MGKSNSGHRQTGGGIANVELHLEYADEWGRHHTLPYYAEFQKNSKTPSEMSEIQQIVLFGLGNIFQNSEKLHVCVVQMSLHSVSFRSSSFFM